MKELLFGVIGILFTLSSWAQDMNVPEAPEPLCESLECFSEASQVRSLNLKKELRRGGRPDSSGLDKLLWLDLSANRLDRVPEWVCQCTSLEYLNLSRNRLNSLPPCLEKLKNLKYLAANRNPLGSLPVQLSDCTQLKYLDLWQTWIDFVPWELHNLNESLKVVDLRDITMTREQQMAIYKVFPDVELRLSAWCNCAVKKNRQRR